MNYFHTIDNKLHYLSQLIKRLKYSKVGIAIL